MSSKHLAFSKRHVSGVFCRPYVIAVLAASASALQSCGTYESSDVGFEDVPSFEEFMASTYREEWEDGVFIVDGDTPIDGVERLREFYHQLYGNSAGTNIGQSQSPLIVNLRNGADDVWSVTERTNITYCISNSFGNRKNAVINAMNRAECGWETSAPVQFVYRSGEDGNCTNANNNVEFDVRPVYNQSYLARAFFPGDRRAVRNVLIDSTAFTSDWPLERILTHELGHALGFRHEHTRPQAGTCFEDNNWRALTVYDSTSVMHYPQCNGQGEALTMSGNDRAGTRILYGALPLGDAQYFGASMWFKYSDARSTPVVGDFDNDGSVDDIAYYGRCGSGGPDCWRVHLSNGSSFTTVSFGADMWFKYADARSTPVAGDFDNDGFVDDIAYYGRCGTGGPDCWRVHLSNGSSFTTASFGANMWFKYADARSTPVAGDFDNDGLVDDIGYYGRCGSGGPDCWRVHLSNGSGFVTRSFGASMWFAGSNPTYRPVAGDFDLDGEIDDIAYRGLCGSCGAPCWRVHRSNGSQFVAAAYGDSTWFKEADARSTPLVGDFNNDGRSDIAYYGRCGSGGPDCWRAHIRTAD